MELYIHLPFCKKKCDYCSFCSSSNRDESEISRYLDALIKEITLAGKKYPNSKITSIYFGGGTPSVLSAEQFSAVFCAVKKSFNINFDAEITVEGNPESLSEEKLSALSKIGVNRLSVGVQSLYDDNLNAVGRLHDANTALSVLKTARKYFENLSADLILGLPYDTNERVAREVELLIPLVSHISVYLLSVEKGTKLFERKVSGDIALPEDDKQIDFVHIVSDILVKNGFNRYEYSNFARPNYDSKHNTGYWKREEYIGFGLNASSLVKTSDGQTKLEIELRYKNTDDFDEYCRRLESSTAYTPDLAESEYLSKEEVLREEIMLGLRLTEGIDKNKVLARISPENSILNDYFVTTRDKSGEKISISPYYFDVMNSIISMIV